MFKQLILPILGVIAFIVFVGFLVNKNPSIKFLSTGGTPTTGSQAKTITIGNKIFSLEIADNEPKRQKGLSGRTKLDSGSGMLFVFDSKGVNPSFWMKDMLIPLDIIWISGDKVIKIDKNAEAPASGTPNNQLKIYTPGQSIDYVLEVNAGVSDSSGISVGSSVDLSKI